MKICRIFFTSLLLFGISMGLRAADFDRVLDRQPPILQLQQLDEAGTYKLRVENEQIFWEGELVIRPDKPFCKELEAGFSFCGRLAKDGEAFQGYFQSGILQYSFRLQKDKSGKLVGAWQNLVGYEAPEGVAPRAVRTSLVTYAVPY